MRPWLRVSMSALVVGLLASAAGTASAQFYDAARRYLDFAPDPLERSARLIGMGRLTLVGDDRHNELALWDFAGNPVGIATDDTASSFELRPGTSSESSVHDILGTSRERQTLAAREMRLGYEGWRHTRTGTAYGAIGDFGMLRYDVPYDEATERRTSLSNPNVQAAISGRVPFLLKGPYWRYALRGFASDENSEALYRDDVLNGAGDYIDLDGVTVGQPQIMVPNKYESTSLGGGAALGLDLGRPLVVALGGDLISSDIVGSNDLARSNARTTERRPLLRGQLTMVGKAGRHLEWGLDAQGWKVTSEERWAFSISAGVGTDPLTGRGKLLTREEAGNAVHGRLRWVQGPWEAGAGVQTQYRRIRTTPAGLDDPTSFNTFLILATLRANADSIALPAFLLPDDARERSYEYSGGLARQLLGGRGRLGAEVHVGRDDLTQLLAGHGPQQVFWDVRLGGEYACTPLLTGRAGYIHRSDDRDKLLVGNKFADNALSLGLGYRPGHGVWSVESGYVVEWFRADYGDPQQPRGSRQQLLTQIRWGY